jgi:hypothetical protein
MTSITSRAHRVLGLAAATAAVAGGLIGATVVAPDSAEAAGTRPSFRVPFTCDQTWRADTRDGHSPSDYAVDFNFGSGWDDFGKVVRASEPGTVVFAGTGAGSYGKTVVVAHGDGWRTRYAHLNEIRVSKDQKVSDTTVLGTVGKSGLSSSSLPHLHYEQLADGVVKPAKFVNSSVVYFGSSYHTRTTCG